MCGEENGKVAAGEKKERVKREERRGAPEKGNVHRPCILDCRYERDKEI